MKPGTYLMTADLVELLCKVVQGLPLEDFLTKLGQEEIAGPILAPHLVATQGLRLKAVRKKAEALIRLREQLTLKVQ